MEENKVYLLMEETGEYDDYTFTPIDSFISEELANKAMNGLNEYYNELIRNSPLSIYRNSDTYKTIRPSREHERFMEEYRIMDKIYWKELNLNHNYFPFYSIEIINLRY